MTRRPRRATLAHGDVGPEEAIGTERGLRADEAVGHEHAAVADHGAGLNHDMRADAHFPAEPGGGIHHGARMNAHVRNGQRRGDAFEDLRHGQVGVAGPDDGLVGAFFDGKPVGDDGTGGFGLVELSGVGSRAREGKLARRGQIDRIDGGELWSGPSSLPEHHAATWDAEKVIRSPRRSRSFSGGWWPGAKFVLGVHLVDDLGGDVELGVGVDDFADGDLGEQFGGGVDVGKFGVVGDEDDGDAVGPGVIGDGLVHAAVDGGGAEALFHEEFLLHELREVRGVQGGEQELVGRLLVDIGVRVVGGGEFLLELLHQRLFGVAAILQTLGHDFDLGVAGDLLVERPEGADDVDGGDARCRGAAGSAAAVRSNASAAKAASMAAAAKVQGRMACMENSSRGYPTGASGPSPGMAGVMGFRKKHTPRRTNDLSTYTTGEPPGSLAGKGSERDAQGKTDDLALVARGLGDREPQVEGQGDLAEERDGQADAQTGVGADGADGDVGFHVADIDEDDSADDFLVDGVVDFAGGDPEEVAANGVFVGVRGRSLAGSGAAELEAAEGADAAAVETFVSRRGAQGNKVGFIAEGEDGFAVEKVGVEGVVPVEGGLKECLL